MNLPKRSDPIYQEIENFEDYEYTNCIAYEMAIRNIKNKKLTKEFEKNLNIEDIIYIIKTEYDEDIHKKEFFDWKIKLKAFEIITLLNPLEYFGYRKVKNFFNKKPTFNEAKDFNDYIHQLKDHSHNKFLYRDRTSATYYENTKNTEVRIHFDRPELRCPEYLNVEVNRLNLNLPKEELIAYILKIKDEYDKDNTIFKNPLEMLGEVTEKTDNKSPKKNTIADKFFIYDYYKAVKNKSLADIDIWRDIDLELIMHYDYDVLKGAYYSEKTYKNTKKEMIDFIDNLGYKELITGTANKG